LSEETKKNIESFLKSARKEFGDESVITAKDKKTNVDVISTGSVKIDIATGIGGIPRGRITEVFGMESSGKTTLALQAAANCQKAGHSVLFVDVEHALDPKYARNLGIDMDELIISQPDNGEQALDIIKFGLQSKAFGMIVLDSVASLVPRVVFEGDMADANVGIVARLMSKACPLFADLASDANTAVLMINQIRSTIGISYGDPTVTSGGKALKFYASVRMQTFRSTLHKDGELVVGNTVKVKVVKNKLAPPFRECETEIVYGEGFSRESDLIDLGQEKGFIERSGAWYTINGERLQGKEKATQYLLVNPAYCSELEAQVIATLG
jgi:recombination protein RecA